MTSLVVYGSRHAFPPDHKGMAPARTSVWVREEPAGQDPGPWYEIVGPVRTWVAGAIEGCESWPPR